MDNDLFNLGGKIAVDTGASRDLGIAMAIVHTISGAQKLVDVGYLLEYKKEPPSYTFVYG